MLKYFLSWTLLLLSIVVSAQSPAFQANSIVKKDVQEVLQKQFYNYQLQRLPIEAIHRHVSTADRSDFMLNNNQDINWNIQLQAYDIRSDQYRLRAATSNGTKEFNKGENITYRGQLANVEGSDVRLTIAPGFFYGLVQTNSTTYYIEPLSYFIDNAAVDQFVVYQEADVIPTSGKTCGVTEAQQRKEQMEAVGKKKHNENTLSAMGPCFDVEIAIASDFSMYTKYGNSIVNVQNHNIGVMNNVQTNYDDEFTNNLNFVIVENFVSNCSTCDPWTSSTSAGVLLDDFTAWGNGGGFSVPYDVAQHWTNRNFNGSTIGIAWVGAVCGNNRYHCLQDFSNNAQSLRVLTAHELGHNFNSFHDNNNTCIMSPSVNNATCWSTQSTNAINSFSGALVGGCLSACQGSTPPPIADFSATPIDGCTPVVVQFTDDSSNNPDSWDWTFPGGDPATSSVPNPTVTYNAAGTYSVTLEVSNAGGTDTKTENNFINVSPLPFADFEASINLGTVDFLNTSQNGTSYFWDFGDGNNSTEFEPTHIYFQSGFYDVVLTVSSICGQVTTNRTIQVVLPPTADFMGTPTSGCAPLVVDFTDLSTNIPEDWFWTFEQGIPATSEFQNPTVEFPVPGSFSVTLDVFNLSGSDSYTITNYITVDGLPDVDFLFSTNGLEVSFVNSSTNAISYSWDFGDGNTSTDVNPTHTYTQGGNYDVMLTALNDCGMESTTQTVSLIVAPQAAFGSDVVNGCTPLTVNFVDQSVSASSWSWSFPGGTPSTSTAQNPTVTYPNAGSYSVTLIASNGFGNSTVTETDYITVAPLADPDFTTSSDENTITFTNTSTNATSYSWEFGDGTGSTEENPTHTYPDDGEYTVILTATNNCGSETTEQIITTSSIPQAAFTAENKDGCGPLTVSFIDQSTENTISWSWSFPGGIPSTSTEQNPTVVYETAGTYTVTLIASNSNGETTVTATDFVNVAPLPTPGFFTDINGTQVIFTNTTINGDQFVWDFGDGSTSTEMNPVYIFSMDGEYDVILTAENECGTISTGVVTVTIVSIPQADFTAATRSGCAPLTVEFQDESSESATSWEWSFEGGTPAASTEQNPTVVYDTPGTYTVVLTVGNASGSNTLTQIEYIEVFAETVADFELTNVGDEISIVNNSTNATGFVWSFGDGTTSMEVNPTHVYAENGTYTVSLTAVGLCGMVTTTQEVLISVTNIIDENKIALFEVYPNPGSGNVIINLEGEPTINLEIRLIDVLGRILYSEKEDFNGRLTREYDWTHFAAGTYIVQLRAIDAIGYRRIVIEK